MLFSQIQNAIPNNSVKHTLSQSLHRSILITMSNQINTWGKTIATEMAEVTLEDIWTVFINEKLQVAQENTETKSTDSRLNKRALK